MAEQKANSAVKRNQARTACMAQKPRDELHLVHRHEHMAVERGKAEAHTTQGWRGEAQAAVRAVPEASSSSKSCMAESMVVRLQSEVVERTKEVERLETRRRERLTYVLCQAPAMVREDAA